MSLWSATRNDLKLVSTNMRIAPGKIGAQSAANGGTIGFAMDSPELGDAWHAAGIANGGTTCEDPPGLREGPMGKLYLAYLRDPAGNKICALKRMY